MRARCWLALAVVVAAGAARAEETWALPEPSGVELFAALTLSSRDYSLVLYREATDIANPPERIEIVMPDRDRKTLDRAARQTERGQPKSAMRALNALLRKTPANYDALVLRARCHFAQDDTKAALADLRASLIGNRRNPDAWKLLEEIAAKLGQRVERPTFTLKGWIEAPAEEIEFGYADRARKWDLPWSWYGTARAWYRYEVGYRRDFPDAKDYRFTFREHLFAMGAVVKGAAERREEGKKVAPDQVRLLVERDAGRIVPFLYFATYGEVLPPPKEREKGFGALEPVLVKYLDEHVLVKAGE